MEILSRSIFRLLRNPGCASGGVCRGEAILNVPGPSRCKEDRLGNVSGAGSQCSIYHIVPPSVLCSRTTALCFHTPLNNGIAGRHRDTTDTLPLTASPFRRTLVEVKFKKENKDTSKIPFKVVRTPSGNLPVYSRIRKHGTVVTTIIRHAFGDITALKKDLLAVCEAPVRERCGTVEVKGLHVLKIKQWLTHLGF